MVLARKESGCPPSGLRCCHRRALKGRTVSPVRPQEEPSTTPRLLLTWCRPNPSNRKGSVLMSWFHPEESVQVGVLMEYEEAHPGTRYLVEFADSATYVGVYDTFYESENTGDLEIEMDDPQYDEFYQVVMRVVATVSAGCRGSVEASPWTTATSRLGSRTAIPGRSCTSASRHPRAEESDPPAIAATAHPGPHDHRSNVGNSADATGAPSTGPS